ncbi:MAG TPA: magnesium transporter [Polyangia bacterium]|jgi:magnesium transporter|nr:magnesium transporter [Polyangia bacterium]
MSDAVPEAPIHPETSDRITETEVRDTWPLLTRADRALAFHLLSREQAGDFFLAIGAADQAELLATMAPAEKRTWIRVLPPDDAADVVQAASDEDKPALMGLLDEATRREVSALLAHAEDRAGGLMDPRYSRLRADMSIDEAVRYLRQQLRERRHSLPYAYVLDTDQRLLGVVPFWQLLVESGTATVRAVMKTDVVSIQQDLPQEDVARMFEQYHLKALPIVDGEGRMKGVVTVDDVVDVVREAATEDIQKFGGVEALDEPYLRISLPQLLKKRVGWLAALFIGEMLTATAMGYFEKEIARAVVLALFVPLIISSGGNSGSQASTLVIRAMSLGEVRIRDWWRVMRRELFIGIGLGAVLAVIGFMRIMIWSTVFHAYGDHATAVAMTVAASLVGVVLWGSLAGSMLPFGLRRVGFDPASACAPLVATLVDVSGLVIYFSVAAIILRGRLL